MNSMCPNCCHLMPPGEAHTCPTPEYYAVRNALIAAACTVEEQYDSEEEQILYKRKPQTKETM